MCQKTCNTGCVSRAVGCDVPDWGSVACIHFSFGQRISTPEGLVRGIYDLLAVEHLGTIGLWSMSLELVE